MFKTFKYLIGVPLVMLLATVVLLLITSGVLGAPTDTKVVLQTWAEISKVYVGAMTALFFYEFYKDEAD